MAVQYQPVIWNRNKKIYDFVLIVMVIAYVGIFLNLAPQFAEDTRKIDGAILRMRAWGSCAFLMLTVILCIGPLARLDRRFLPLLYNRRHFGVMTAIVASIHATTVLGWYMAFSPPVPYDGYWVTQGFFTQMVRLLQNSVGVTEFIGFPIEFLGIAALLILFVMAATSHDFWMHFLTPPVWKAIHMAVYPCYALVVMHAALGYLQSNKNPGFAIVVALGAGLVIVLHVMAAVREARREAEQTLRRTDETMWYDAGPVGDIPDKRAITAIIPGGDKVAIYRYEGKVSAIANACAHQNGPLGEGRIIGGCVTCPWHGFQYDPATGRSPPPFTEKIATYNLKLDGDRILIDRRANPPGTHVDPVVLPDELAKEAS